MSDIGDGQLARGPLGYLLVITKNIAGTALLLMLASVLLPTAYYSYHLKDPTPSQLLVAICIGVFSSVVFLWILDAVSTLKFRAEWISKSVYGAAIVSILGTSAGVYKDAFSESKYPYEGRWELQVFDAEPANQEASTAIFTTNSIALVYSTQSETYWGYSDYRQPTSSDDIRPVWAAIDDFNPDSGRIVLSVYPMKGEKRVLDAAIEKQRTGKLFVGQVKTTVIRLARPN